MVSVDGKVLFIAQNARTSLFIGGKAVNFNTNVCSVGQNKRRKSPNWPSWVNKNRFSNFLKFSLAIWHTACGRVMIKLQFEPKSRRKNS